MLQKTRKTIRRNITQRRALDAMRVYLFRSFHCSAELLSKNTGMRCRQPRWVDQCLLRFHQIIHVVVRRNLRFPNFPSSTR